MCTTRVATKSGSDLGDSDSGTTHLFPLRISHWESVSEGIPDAQVLVGGHHQNMKLGGLQVTDAACGETHHFVSPPTVIVRFPCL